MSESATRPDPMTVSGSRVLPVGPISMSVPSARGQWVMSDCQRGECGVCAVPVIEGEIDHRDVFFSRSQQEGNRQLCTCVSRAVATESRTTETVTRTLR